MEWPTASPPVSSLPTSTLNINTESIFLININVDLSAKLLLLAKLLVANLSVTQYCLSLPLHHSSSERKGRILSRLDSHFQRDVGSIKVGQFNIEIRKTTMPRQLVILCRNHSDNISVQPVLLSN